MLFSRICKTERSSNDVCCAVNLVDAAVSAAAREERDASDDVCTPHHLAMVTQKQVDRPAVQSRPHTHTHKRVYRLPRVPRTVVVRRIIAIAGHIRAENAKTGRRRAEQGRTTGGLHLVAEYCRTPTDTPRHPVRLGTSGGLKTTLLRHCMNGVSFCSVRFHLYGRNESNIRSTPSSVA